LIYRKAIVEGMCGDNMEIDLKDGPINRCYGNGEDPDPFGARL
jgi:hypothetical protein